MNRILRTNFLPTLLVPQAIELRQRIQAVTFRNAGTSTAQLAYGRYELAPGETLHIAAVDNADYIDINGLYVSFDTSVGSDNKLQWFVLQVDNC